MQKKGSSISPSIGAEELFSCAPVRQSSSSNANGARDRPEEKVLCPAGHKAEQGQRPGDKGNIFPYQ